jgi:hypothetical protein
MDHLKRAKDYIVIAESSDSKIAAYKKAADEIIKARKADAGLGYREIDRQLGRSDSGNGRYSQRLVKWRTSAARPTQLPFGGEDENARKDRGALRTILKDPEHLERVIPDLPTRALQELADRADEAVAERREARRSEQGSGVTGRQISDFQPDEFWMDKVTIRANRALREAADLLKRGGGLFGSMTSEEALDYWTETERLASEVRVVLQARVRDEVKV